MKRPKTLDKVLNTSNSELEVLVTHAKQLHRLQGHYQQAVSENLANNCQVANMQNGVLTLCCQSAAWTTRAKMEKHQLLSILREFSAFHQIEEINVITRPKSQAIEKKEEFIKIPMSRESASIISDMANSIPDQDLSAALKRLSRHKTD